MTLLKLKSFNHSTRWKKITLVNCWISSIFIHLYFGVIWWYLFILKKLSCHELLFRKSIYIKIVLTTYHCLRLLGMTGYIVMNSISFPCSVELVVTTWNIPIRYGAWLRRVLGILVKDIQSRLEISCCYHELDRAWKGDWIHYNVTRHIEQSHQW